MYICHEEDNGMLKYDVSTRLVTIEAKPQQEFCWSILLEIFPCLAKKDWINCVGETPVLPGKVSYSKVL